MSFEKLRRVNYTPPTATTNCLSGQAVEADFQQYHLPAARAHNLALHGIGVAAGLSLSVSGGRVVVSPGAAVDRMGQLIVLAANSRFFSGEAMTVSTGSAGVDLPPASTMGGPLQFIATIEYGEDPRADDPASPQCGMVELVPWVRLRPAGTDVGDAVGLGTVVIDDHADLKSLSAEGRRLVGQSVGELQVRRSDDQSGHGPVSEADEPAGTLSPVNNGVGLRLGVSHGPLRLEAESVTVEGDLNISGRLTGQLTPNLVGTAQIQANAVTEEKLDAHARIPVGTVLSYVGTTAPAGWLLCDGSVIDPHARPELANLATILGNQFDPSGTAIRVPDLRGRVVVGTSAGHGLGGYGGAETHTLSIEELPPHSHGVNDPGHSHGVNDPGHSHGVNDPGHSHELFVTANFNTGGPAIRTSFTGDGHGANRYETHTEVGGNVTHVSLNASFSGIHIADNTTGINLATAGA